MKIEYPIDNRVELKELKNGDVFTYDNRVYMFLGIHHGIALKEDSLGSFCKCWDFTKNCRVAFDGWQFVNVWPNAILKLQGDYDD